MLKEDFVFNLTLKYRAGDRVENSKRKNELFTTELYTFMKYCPEKHLEDVFNHVSRSVKPNFIPSLKPFYDYAEEMEYIVKGAVKKQKKVWWCICRKCRKEYGPRGRRCPVCGSLKFDIKCVEKAIDAMPSNIELIQEDCPICTIYEKRNEDRNYVFGPECNSYGIGTQPFANCKDCFCRTCCNQYSALLEDSKKFKLKMQNGQYKMPWLNKEKLNKKIVNGGKN